MKKSEVLRQTGSLLKQLLFTHALRMYFLIHLIHAKKEWDTYILLSRRSVNRTMTSYAPFESLFSQL